VVTHEIVKRVVRLGPVGSAGQPAPGAYTFHVQAFTDIAINPAITGNNASIVVLVSDS
jgi:hypothetical protein